MVYKSHSSLTGTRVSWRSGVNTRGAWNILFCQKMRKCSENGEYVSKRLKTQLQGSPTPHILDNLSIKKIEIDFNSLNKIRVHQSILIKLNKGEETEFFLTVQCQVINVEERIALENDFSIIRGITASGKNHWMLKQVTETLMRNTIFISPQSISPQTTIKGKRVTV